jgi:CRP-like cAMP-binding protein
MENLRDQIFQATDNFLAAVQQLTQQHAALLFQDTSSSLGRAPRSSTAARSRGAKRGTDELNQLSGHFTQFVRDNPGLRIEQINKQLGTTTAALALPIRKLIASGVVSVKGRKRATTYFSGKSPTETSSRENGKKAAPVGKGVRRRSRPKKSHAGTRSRSKG